MRPRVTIHNHYSTRDAYKARVVDREQSLEGKIASLQMYINQQRQQAGNASDPRRKHTLQEGLTRLERELADLKSSRDAARDTFDHWNKVSTVGRYDIFEGAGVNGSQWAAKERPGFGRGSSRESKVFKSRRQAEEHAELSSGY